MAPSYESDEAKGRVLSFLFLSGGSGGSTQLIITSLHSLTTFFTWTSPRPTLHPFTVVALLIICLLRGEMNVMIRLSFCIMSFCHEFVLNFILKWAHYSHFVKPFRTFILPWSTFNISPSVTLKCELALTFLSGINPEPNTKPYHSAEHLSTTCVTLARPPNLLIF